MMRWVHSFDTWKALVSLDLKKKCIMYNTLSSFCFVFYPSLGRYSPDTIDYLRSAESEDLDMDLTASLVQHIHQTQVVDVELVLLILFC